MKTAKVLEDAKIEFLPRHPPYSNLREQGILSYETHPMKRIRAGENGIALFNHAHFFEAHEALEDVWRAAPAPEKKFWQGLIQVAVGFHHFSAGNQIGAQSLFARASLNLGAYPTLFRGIQLQPLLESLSNWREALEKGKIDLPFPIIQFSDATSSD